MVTQLLTKHSDIVFAAVVGGGGGTNLTVTRGDAGDSATLNCDSMTYALRRQLIEAQRVGLDASQPQLVEDLGKMSESVTLKGTIKTKTEWDKLQTICKDWFVYGTITLTYTWANTATTLFVGFVDNFSCDNRAGEVDIFDYGLTLSIGQERSS